MKKFLSFGFVFPLLVAHLNSGCTKRVGLRPLVDIIDTTLQASRFTFNGENQNWHVKCIEIDEKIFLSSTKSIEFEHTLVPFHYFGLGFLPETLKRQKLETTNYNDPFSATSPCWAIFSTMADDGDVGCEEFIVDVSDSLSNFVQITKELNNFQEIWGKYSVTLVKVQGCASGFYSDKLTIRNGYFHVIVE
jgi:hypothetical protein